MGEAVVTAVFGGRPSSVSAARRWAARLCAAMGVADKVEDVRLVVSELATNAVVHAGTTFGLELRFAPDGAGSGWVRVAVSDRVPWPPKERPAGQDDENGRGLAVVSHLGRYGVEAGPEGKTVWVELDGAR